MLNTFEEGREGWDHEVPNVLQDAGQDEIHRLVREGSAVILGSAAFPWKFRLSA